MVGAEKPQDLNDRRRNPICLTNIADYWRNEEQTGGCPEASALVRVHEVEDEALAEPGDGGTWGNLKNKEALYWKYEGNQ